MDPNKRARMKQESTSDYAKKMQGEAQWAYNKAMEKFYYSMLEVVFLRIKSHLNKRGLKKVIEMDNQRNINENFGVEFSQKTWAVLAEAWVSTESIAMTKIAELYGLEIADLDISKIQSPNKQSITPKCNPTN